MPRAKRDPETEVPFYWVQIIDAELGKIRFGPMVSAEFPPGFQTPKGMAEQIADDIRSHGLTTALTMRGIYGGLRVILKGDDGTNIPIAEVEAP